MRKLLLAVLLAAQPVFAANQGKGTALPVTINLLTPGLSAPGAQASSPNTTAVGGQNLAVAASVAPNASGFLTVALQQAAAGVKPGQIPAIAASAIPNAKLPTPGAAVAASAADKSQASALSQAGIAATAKDGSAFDGSQSWKPAEQLVAVSGGSAEQTFNLAYPSNRSALVLASIGARFEDFAAEMLMKQVYIPDQAGMNVAEKMVPPHHPLYAELLDFSKKVVALAERQDAVGRGFAAALGRHYAHQALARGQLGSDGWRLPEDALKGRETWDLAAGPNAAHLMMTPQIDNTKLVFFDRSSFVISYLEHSRRLIESRLRKPMSHVEIRQADLNSLTKPADAPSIIRWKNVHTYVDGFERRFEEMAGWLADGGKMLIQNDLGWGQRMGIITKLGPKIQSLIKQGYVFDYKPLGKGDLETLTLTKPAAGADVVAQKQSSVNSMKRWEDYIKEVQRVNDAERRNPFSFFFR